MIIKKLPVWVFCVLFACLCGCSGGGSSSGTGVATSTPESAVYELLAAWQKSEAALVAAEEGGTVVEQESTTEPGYIRFRDLNGEEWQLHVDDVIFNGDSNAEVHTSYQSLDANRGSLKLLFYMIRDMENWYLDTIDVIEMPVVVVTGTGIKGIVSDISSNLPVDGALISIYDAQTNTFIENTTTDETGFYSFELDPGTYYLVIERDGYEPLTYTGVTVG